MFKILYKKELSPGIFHMDIEAPRVAKKAQAGQFIVLRIDEQGERVPLTIADFDREKGTITIIFQVLGASTMQLSQMNEGDALLYVLAVALVLHQFILLLEPCMRLAIR